MPVHREFPRQLFPPFTNHELHHGYATRERHLALKSCIPNIFSIEHQTNGLKLSSNGVSSASSSVSGGHDHDEIEQLNNAVPEMSSLAHNYADPSMKTHYENDARQLRFIKETGYQIVQRNGQRITGGPPPGWIGPPPTKTEIFVGKVPRDMYEFELYPVFEQCGLIYEMRLMMDFSGSNRGYLFVRYSKREEAKRAVRDLNNYEIKPGKFIGVMLSVDNCKLWISGIPKNRSADEIKGEMSKLTDGVRAVYIYNQQNDKSKTRGYAFVEYMTHRHAALARRKLVPGRNFLFDQEIERVDWAEPENEVDDEIMAKVKVLFIRNLPARTTEDDIHIIFEPLSNGQVERVKKTKDYAFVHFNTREAAEKAYEATVNKLKLGDCVVEVTWSKPIDRQIHSQRKQLTRVLTSGTPMVPSYPPIPMATNNPFSAAPMFMNGMNNTGVANRGAVIAPRPRGAAGIRGLGAPGTPPPRALMRKLNASQGFNSFNNNVFNAPDICELMKHLSLSPDMGSEAAAAAAAYNAAVVPPPGAPNSPTSTGPGFFGNNMRMMAPNLAALQSPFIYYNNGFGH